MLETGDAPAASESPAATASASPDKTRVSLTVPPKIKRAIETIATLEKTDNADVLLNRTIAQVVAEYDKLKVLFTE